MLVPIDSSFMDARDAAIGLLEAGRFREAAEIIEVAASAMLPVSAAPPLDLPQPSELDLATEAFSAAVDRVGRVLWEVAVHAGKGEQCQAWELLAHFNQKLGSLEALFRAVEDSRSPSQ